MKTKRILSWGIVSMLFLTACTSTPATEEPSPELPTETPKPTETQPVEPPLPTTDPGTEPTAYPLPQKETANTPEAYPLPGGSSALLTGEMQAYLLPQEGDQKLTRETVFLEPDSGLIVMKGAPTQVFLRVMGSLPTPCHQLRAVTTTDEKNKRVDVELYTLVDPGTVCITVLSPFDHTIPLGSFSSGKYTVFINDEKLDEFNS